MTPNNSRTYTTKIAATASVQRNVTVRTKSGRGTEDKSYAADAMDHRRLVLIVDLVAQPAHMHVDEVGLWDELVFPHLFEQHGTRQRLVLATHHILEQAEFPRQQLNGAVAALCRTLDEIELERPDLKFRLEAGGRTPQQGFDPCDQLDEIERLGEIVVTSRPQSPYAIVDGPESAQDQDRGAHLILSQGFDDGDTVHSWQQSIDDHCIRISGAGLIEPFDAGRSPVDFEPMLSELGYDLARHFAVVLDEEKFSHRCFPAQHGTIFIYGGARGSRRYVGLTFRLSRRHENRRGAPSGQ